MSLKKRLRVLLACAALQMGVFAGVPMRPEEIQALMHQMNQPKLAQMLPADDDGGDPPPGPRAYNAAHAPT